MHGPWSQEAFEEALQRASEERIQWAKATAFLDAEFRQRLAMDSKFAAAIKEVQSGKAKAIGYLQGQLMGALKKEGLPALGELLTPWLAQRIQQTQSTKEST